MTASHTLGQSQGPAPPLEFRSTLPTQGLHSGLQGQEVSRSPEKPTAHLPEVTSNPPQDLGHLEGGGAPTHGRQPPCAHPQASPISPEAPDSWEFLPHDPASLSGLGSWPSYPDMVTAQAVSCL